MTVRIQNISKEQYDVDCVVGNEIINKNIKTNEILEITDNCLNWLKHYRWSKFRVVNKPQQRYNNQRVVGIWCVIIWIIWTLIVQEFTK